VTFASKDAEFEKKLLANLDLIRFSPKIIIVWDGNHRLKT
jgi:hypothetical protein